MIVDLFPNIDAGDSFWIMSIRTKILSRYL